MISIDHTASRECEILHNADWGNADTIPRDIFNFYLLSCPYAKSDSSAASSSTGLNLSNNGWEKAKLHQLMQWIATHFVTPSGDLQLVYRASDVVNETISELELDAEMPCVSHMRCALQINRSIKVTESGECYVKLKETYATCFFRHIRNAFAHGNFAVNEQGQIILLDYSSKPNTDAKNQKYTFGMVSSMQFLRDLKCLVESRPADDKFVVNATQKLNGNSYRIKLDREIHLDEQEQ